MLELRVLGPPRISAPGGARSVETLIRQPRRLALLAYLATAGRRGSRRRDTLLALFWPESDEPHARAALSQALYVLRSALGEGAIVSGINGQLALDPSIVWCDTVAFEAALDAGRPAEALPLYRGDLLDGFHVSDAPEFEHWLDQERARLRQHASDGAWTLAESMAADGRVLEAERWARRAAELLPADEAVVRRLMIFLRGLGDRAAAIRAYEAFAWTLGRDLELEPSAETQALAHAIRGEQGDVAIPIELPRATPRGILAGASRGRTRARLAILALLVLGLVASTFAWRREVAPSPRSLMRFPLDLAGAPPLSLGVGGSTIALSPDGLHLAYVGAGAEGPQLFLRPMDRIESTPIPYTLGATHPFFSPDGEWLGFVSGGAIRKVRLTGGPAIEICDVATNVPGASWGDNEVIVFATPAGLWRVPASGGEPTLLAPADTARGERYRWPEMLPGGRAAVFTRVHATGFELAAVALHAGVVRPLGVSGTNPRLVEPGHLVFVRTDGAFLAAPFDVAAARLTGPATHVLEGVSVGIAGAAKLGVSSDGALAYVPETTEGTLVLVDRSGRAEPLPPPRQIFGSPRFSSDGQKVVVSAGPREATLDLWLIDIASGSMRRATFDGGGVSPVLARSPAGGDRIAFAMKPGGRGFGWEIRSMSFPSGEVMTLLEARHGQFPGAFTPDGRSLVFQRSSPETSSELWILPLDGAHAPRPYARGLAARGPAMSPNGRWLAWVSDASGRDEVYVGAFPEPGTPVRVTSGGGREPRWAPVGNVLYYRSDSGMSAVRLDEASGLRVVGREVLFDDKSYVSSRGSAAYDVHPDGEHFLMIRRGPPRGDVLVTLHWLDALRLRTR